MIETKKLVELLRAFNIMGYSDPNAKYLDNGKNGKIIKLEKECYVYEDEFYGGEPYSGNETIWENRKDIFRCVYWGKVMNGVKFTDIYAFLRKALAKGPDSDLVHRGPKEFVEGRLKYTNVIEGTIEDFRQTERIFMDGKEVYIAYFFGGRVNVQTE